MWKKNESDPPSSSQAATPASSRSDPSPSRPDSPRRMATIGPAISIKGDISGQGDLVIEGKVQGAIQLKQHNVTVGRAAHVEANILGKKICVDGEVHGDLFGEEVVIRESGRVIGNATAARVTLENGCSFRGAIDMRPDESGKTASVVRQPKKGASTAR